MDILYFENKYDKKKLIEELTSKFDIEQIDDSKSYLSKDGKVQFVIENTTITAFMFDEDRGLKSEIKDLFYRKMKPSKMYLLMEKVRLYYKWAITITGTIGFWIIVANAIFGGKIVISNNLISWILNLFM